MCQIKSEIYDYLAFKLTSFQVVSCVWREAFCQLFEVLPMPFFLSMLSEKFTYVGVSFIFQDEVDEILAEGRVRREFF